MVRKILLVCGFLSSLLYVATDILGGMQYEGYSFTSQAISELGAIGAPSKPFLDVLMLVYAVLLFLFGTGVWRSAGQKRVLRVVAGQPESRSTLRLVLFRCMRGASRHSLTPCTSFMQIASLLLLIAMERLPGSEAVVSIRSRLSDTPRFVLSLDARRMQANLPTPWVGVTERVNVYGYLLWVAVLAIALLRERGRVVEFRR
jgi:hypothetical protein